MKLNHTSLWTRFVRESFKINVHAVKFYKKKTIRKLTDLYLCEKMEEEFPELRKSMNLQIEATYRFHK